MGSIFGIAKAGYGLLKKARKATNPTTVKVKPLSDPKGKEKVEHVKRIQAYNKAYVKPRGMSKDLKTSEKRQEHFREGKLRVSKPKTGPKIKD